jgi:uncharacterized protein with von Willebrand factor type A (vWA) domain
MKRIILDVPKWHVYLHRDARGLETATELDGPVQKLEDEVFDKVYSGDAERLPDKHQDAKLRTWADAVHEACERLPAFSRLASECRGDALAAGMAVEALMAELRPELSGEPEAKPQDAALRRSVGRGCEKASAAVDELRETMEGLADIGFNGFPGTTSAAGGAMPPASIRTLAARLKSDARLKHIALLAGRFGRIAAGKRRERLKHGADEIADIEQGAELGRLLPAELLRLSHPGLRPWFMKSLVERQAMQYQLIGQQPLGRGPLVVVLDKSGSMDGPRDVWATALTLALLEQAQSERRVFALVAFDYHVKYEAVVKPGEPLPEEALFTACAGGTEIATALRRGLELIAAADSTLRKADIVLITDGGSDTTSAPRLRVDAQALGVTILGLGIGVEREWLEPWCDSIQAIADVSRLDDETASKVFAQ